MSDNGLTKNGGVEKRAIINGQSLTFFVGKYAFFLCRLRILQLSFPVPSGFSGAQPLVSISTVCSDAFFERLCDSTACAKR